jgi:RimJ/RimL family protein N-acetyltransferase
MTMGLRIGSARPAAIRSAVATGNWREGLPVLGAGTVVLRELRVTDAPALLRMLTTGEVARFISPPPTTIEGYERFIAWTHEEREAGRHVCFGIAPAGFDTVIGIIQVRALQPGFGAAEWGFAIGSPFWGTGVFMDAARATIEFAFETVGVVRLEARAAVANGRGNGALAKLGAVREAVLRKSLNRDGEFLDQALWSLLRYDWRQSKAVWGAAVSRGGSRARTH